jgi:hypothetical protein
MVDPGHQSSSMAMFCSLSLATLAPLSFRMLYHLRYLDR